MAKRTLDRKTAFRVALAARNMTASEWAKENGITAGHLSQVLSSGRISESLVTKIDSFIDANIKGLNLVGTAA